jgi:hypothetical protein
MEINIRGPCDHDGRLPAFLLRGLFIVKAKKMPKMILVINWISFKRLSGYRNRVPAFFTEWKKNAIKCLEDSVRTFLKKRKTKGKKDRYDLKEMGVSPNRGIIFQGACLDFWKGEKWLGSDERVNPI